MNAKELKWIQEGVTLHPPLRSATRSSNSGVAGEVETFPSILSEVKASRAVGLLLGSLAPPLAGGFGFLSPSLEKAVRSAPLIMASDSKVSSVNVAEMNHFSPYMKMVRG